MNLTNPNETSEPYLLTPAEEAEILENAILREKEHKRWKMKELEYSDAQIEEKLNSFDWENLIDKKTLFERCNSNKAYDLWQKKQRENEKQQALEAQQLLETEWTANRMFELMKWESENTYKKPFVVNQHNKVLIRTICFFLSRDERFRGDLSHDFQKGVLIRGIAGIGKTYVLKCVSCNSRNPVLVQSMLEIAEEVKNEGKFDIPMGGKKILYLDDVGSEEAPVNYYGTKINWFKNFIETVYLKQTDFSNIIFSTNNSFAELQEKYGFRVVSRLKDMFNVVNVTGTDMRGKK